jgi:hypothetical protein
MRSKNRSRQWSKLKSRTSLIFSLGKANLGASYQYTLTFMFQSIFTLQFDCALSLEKFYDTVVALRFTFQIFLNYPITLVVVSR